MTTVQSLQIQQHQFSFEGMDVAYYRGGSGKPLLLIHGSGPGASSLGNWNPILPSLVQDFEVFTFDLIGFGKSARKATAPYFDFELWVRQAKAMLAQIRPGEAVGIIAHSIAAPIALKLASEDPRIAAVLTTGAMGQPFDITAETKRVWTGPRNRDDLIRTLSGIIYDASVITEAYLAVREPVVFAPGYADYFDAMFEGDKQRYADAAVLGDEVLGKVGCPVMLTHGKQDAAFPASSSEQLFAKLARSELVLLDRCSHSVAFERSSTLVALAKDHFNRHLL